MGPVHDLFISSGEFLLTYVFVVKRLHFIKMGIPHRETYGTFYNVLHRFTPLTKCTLHKKMCMIIHKLDRCQECHNKLLSQLACL